MPREKKIFVKKTKVVSEKDTKDKVIDLKTESNVELTKKYSDAKQAMKEHLEKTPTPIKDDKGQGILIEKSTMKATPKVFVRKVVKTNGEGGTTKIISDDGKKVIYEGRNYEKATQDALKSNEKQEDETNARRDYNANYYNVQSGAKTKINQSDLNKLQTLGKIVKK